MSSTDRIPELDGLRGVAIAMVLVSHYAVFGFVTKHGSLTSYLKALPGLGWSGVDLFFVLSGFLIGGILLDARESSNYFQVFYARRFFRIVPLYSICLFVIFILTKSIVPLIVPRFHWPGLDRIPWYGYALFLQNFW